LPATPAAATVAAIATAYAWDATSLIGLRTIGQLAGTHPK